MILPRSVLANNEPPGIRGKSIQVILARARRGDHDGVVGTDKIERDDSVARIDGGLPEKLPVRAFRHTRY